MKKFLVVFLTLCFLFTTTTAFALDYAKAGGIPASENMHKTFKLTDNQRESYEYMLVINGRVLNINKTRIFLDSDEIMLPIRDLLKGLGFQVRWHGLHRTITAHQADKDFFDFNVDQDGIVMMRGTSYISLERFEKILDKEDVDVKIEIDDAAMMVKGNKAFTSIGVITITGGIDSLGHEGKDFDEIHEQYKDTMVGFITDIITDEDDVEALAEKMDDQRLENLVGAFELDEEIIFLVDEDSTSIELLNEANAEFGDLENGLWVNVTYDKTDLAEDTHVAEKIEESEETIEGRVFLLLDDEDIKDALDITSNEKIELADKLFMNDIENGLLLDSNRLFLIDTDTEISNQDGDDLDLDELEESWLVSVTYHGPKVESDPTTYVAKKVEVVSETKLGNITDILDMDDVELALNMSSSELQTLEDEYNMDEWLGAIKINDDSLFMIGNNTKLYNENDEEIIFGDLENGLLVLITHAWEAMDDSPLTYVARMVKTQEKTVTGRIVTAYGPAGDETAVLVDLDDGDYTLFLIGEDTVVKGAMEENTEVEVTYYNELLDDTPEEYAVKEIMVLEE